MLLRIVRGFVGFIAAYQVLWFLGALEWIKTPPADVGKALVFSLMKVVFFAIFFALFVGLRRLINRLHVKLHPEAPQLLSTWRL